MWELGRVLVESLVLFGAQFYGALSFVVGAFVGTLAALVCLGALALECTRRERPLVRSLVVAALITLPALPALSLELRAQEPPTVEPEYARLFGADSLRLFPGTPRRPVSVSPDGRWIAYESFDSERVDIWVVATAGGAPVRITNGRDSHDRPTWFSSSDRIALGGSGSFIYTVAIDTRSGHPIGPPRQVTIERTASTYGFAISPDGKWIAYPADVGEGRGLRVVPAAGGAARTIWEGERSICGSAVWSPDGYSLLCVEWGKGDSHSVLRVPVDGGESETLSTWSGSGRFTSISPDARYLYRKAAEPSGKPSVWELATVDGRALARFTLPENMAPSGFGPGEGEIIAVLTDIAAPLRILPVNGGPTQQLTETRAYDIPLRWTSDGGEVFFETDLNGQRVYMLAPVDGSAMRQVPLPEPKWRNYMPQLSGDARHVIWVAGKDPSLPPVLKLFSVEENRTEVIAESPCGLGAVFRPAGDGEQYVYCVERDGRNEYRASRVGGPSHLVRSFLKRTGPWAGPSLDVYHDRITFVESTAQGGALYVALAGQEEARQIAAREGRIGTRGMQGPVWSPDGRLVVVGYAAPEVDELAALIVEVSDDGERVGEPRILDVEPGPDWWWDLQWLPDSRGFVILGMGGTSTLDTDIWLVSLDPNDDPVKLTADDPSSVWSFALSPSGRHIAYSSDVVLGSSFWRVDLGEALGSEGR